MRKQILKIGLILIVLSSIGFASTAAPNANFQSWRFGDLFSSHRDLWTSVSRDFRLNDAYTNNYYVIKQVDWFRKKQSYLLELTRNARPYIYYVLQQTRKRGMPPEIALLPMIESNYKPFNYSKRGAIGLWQMMPGTASGFGLKINWWYDGRRDVIASTNAALNYLQYLHDYFHDWLLAIAAYDSGEGRIIAAIRYNRHHHRPTDFWSLPLPYETKIYVPKLLALADVIENHSHYGLRLVPVKNEPFFTPVTLKTQMTLNHLAKLSHTPTQLIRTLNPGFRRWATAPDQPYHFLVPVNKASLLRTNLAKLHQSTSPSSKWIYHRVHFGESLSVIAHQYDTSINALRKINKRKSNALRIGENLLIPIADAEPSFTRIHNRRIAEDHLPGPHRIDHIVTAHDTISKIAHRYRVTPEQIYFWNGFTKNTRLHIHQKIVIWKPKRHKHITQRFYHRVKRGESLGVLAHRYGTTVARIKSSNHLSDNTVRTGQRLCIN